MNRYRRPSKRTTLEKAVRTRRTFPQPSSSVGAQTKIRYKRGKIAKHDNSTTKTTQQQQNPIKTYRTTSVQDPGVPAKPMDQILR